MKNKLSWILVCLIFSLSFVTGASFDAAVTLSPPEKINFEVNPSEIYIVIVRDESVIRDSIKIVNLGEMQKFIVSVNSGSEFINIFNEELVLEKDEEGQIDIVFDSRDYSLGVYEGEILISGEDDFVIPVIFEIEDRNQGFNIFAFVFFFLIILFFIVKYGNKNK